MNTAAADWYPDPRAPEGGLLRYWDGSTWTEHVRDAPSAPDPAAEDLSAASRRSVPVLGARRIARDLIEENDLLAADNRRLRRAVEHYGIEDVVGRTIALDDLEAEIGVQRARLEGLLEHVRSLGLTLASDRSFPL
ncbi:DUF2510 domain-containing protein [Aeromicrobium fastidiosum]|uniref:DUF2510 domain-containing protein n=1 Tax=Aeromicrobium TaxID=2040 RepID=UPI0018D869EA|nr:MULTISPECIES: DUF2510 domain-containing protein [Aeromicrobium]MCL8252189.1 DUF2510 domain-containing protein [Aeromicrobium fastidiosum]